MSVLNKIFGRQKYYSEGKYQPLLEKISSLEGEFEKLSQKQLAEKTNSLKEKLSNGENLQDLIEEAFALVREAAKRTLSQRHFDAQIIGGIILHEGKIAEMKTGEGKTLSATLPAFLNGLEGRGVHIITVNDYLAKRDAVWTGQIYNVLGMTVGCITHEAAFLYDPEYTKEIQDEEKDKERDITGGFKVVESYLRPVSRKEAYGADITYGTNNEFGFDYLRDNMAYGPKEKAQRGFHYAIVDEVDSILIDEARTPLIISGSSEEPAEKYYQFAKLAVLLKENEDFEIDEKMRAVSFTEKGQEKVVQNLGQDPWADNDIHTTHQLESALKAKTLFKRDKDYVVKDGQVLIIDEFTGRILPGRRYSGGLHQAIEAKEGAQVRQESVTMATITFQNYFRMYKKLAGMTGTALTSAEEFDKVYGLEAVPVPTHRPMIRQDLPDRVYKTLQGKFEAVVKEIKERYEKGQPILVGTVSIEKNEYLAKLLEREGIAHNILNAKNHEREGEIIAQAGRPGQVTIATNMAGRGVDIILGGNPKNEELAKRAVESGGLHVIGTERHEARRIDNQLRGRSGRQGDPGSSQFFVSLEDDLMRIFGGDRIKSLMGVLKVPEDQPIEANMVSKAIESAQAKIEGFNFDARKHILEYDDVMNKHREVFYKKRDEVLRRADESSLKSYILEIIKKSGSSEQEYIKKEKDIGEEKMRYLEKLVCLKVLDDLWIEHLEAMEHVRDSVRLRAYGQQDPLIEYKREGHSLFRRFLDISEQAIAHNILKAELKPIAPRTVQAPSPSVPGARKVGRNDPCPCGSGKKFKKCHGS